MGGPQGERKPIKCWLCKKVLPNHTAAKRYRQQAHSLRLSANASVELIVPWAAMHQQKKRGGVCRLRSLEAAKL